MANHPNRLNSDTNIGHDTMNNELYRDVLPHIQRATPGEGPDLIIVTQESNGFIAWRDNDHGCFILHWFPTDRNAAIRYAVHWADDHRSKG